MDLGATLLSTGWASGVNAYATLALLGFPGRAGVGEVPAHLESDPVIVVSIGDVPGRVRHRQDAAGRQRLGFGPHRGPARDGGVLGFQIGGDEGDLGDRGGAGAGGTGTTALASHAVKAGIRLGINTSPEPASNIVASLTEDGLVAVVVLFSINNPEIAAAIAAVLLIAGLGADRLPVDGGSRRRSSDAGSGARGSPRLKSAGR